MPYCTHCGSLLTYKAYLSLCNICLYRVFNVNKNIKIKGRKKPPKTHETRRNKRHDKT